MSPRLVLVGAGPVGLAAAEAAVEDGVVDGPGAVVDPDEAARRRAQHALGFEEDLESLDGLARSDGDLAVVAFSSRARAVAPSLVRLVGLGHHAVTTCEELADPPDELRRELDTAAGKAERTVVATGANPGLVMDRLPLLLAAGSRRVRRVEVVRRLDTSLRRGPLVEKTGRSLAPDEFRHLAGEGRIGHVGMEESARLLAEGLGWTGGEVESSIEPVVDPAGVVQGLHQLVRLRSEGREVVLDLTMAWGAEDPMDRVQVDGEPPLTVEIEGGYHGDTGTTARVVSALRSVPRLAPGFYRPTDLPLGS